MNLKFKKKTFFIFPKLLKNFHSIIICFNHFVPIKTKIFSHLLLKLIFVIFQHFLDFRVKK